MEFFISPEGRRLAHHRTTGTTFGLPGVMFLGGFRSDMTGTKALHLESWAKANGRDFLRFDYSGHGASGGRFEDGCIGDWAEDAAAMLALTSGQQVLVGSSMGGWIALLLARAHPDRVAGLVGIAAAPDFTETLWEEGLTPAQQAEVSETGLTLRPSEYSDSPYPITHRLIEDGRRNMVLGSPLVLPMPVRLLQGTADRDVPPSVALQLVHHIDSPDLCLTLVKDADHRFSTEACLARMIRAVEEVSVRVQDRSDLSSFEQID